jgi:hypothetical protein
VTGVTGVVEVAACDQVGNHLVGNVRRSASTTQPRDQLGAAPRAARKQVARREAGGLGIENFAGRYDFSGAGALSPSVSRILASRSRSTV